MSAPILVTVYNRFGHFRNCIERLQRNDLAFNSVLFVSSDAPYRREDIEPVKRIRDYTIKLNGFKAVIPLFQSTNQGLLNCYYRSINQIFEKYDRLIFLEDDIVVSPDFLQYMNDALDFYKNIKRVYSVSAFSLSIFYPNQVKNKSDIYFTHRFNPWGFGIWKDRFLYGDEYSLDDLRDSLEDKTFINSLNTIGEDLFPAFLCQLVMKKMLTLDYLSVYHMIKNNLITVSPYHSKSFNIGKDGSGDHTKFSKKYNTIDTSFLDTTMPYLLTDKIEYHIDNSFNRMGHNYKINKAKLFLYKLGMLSFVLRIKNYLR